MRLVLDGTRLVHDERAVRPGRGAYVCDTACYERAVAARALPRAFRTAVPRPPNSLDSLDH